MLANYILVFLRNVRRNSFFTFLNIFGLTLGIGVSFMILLFVTDELSYDRFHKDGDRIYRVGMHGVLSGNEFESSNTCMPLSAALSSEVPEVESSVRIGHWTSLLIEKEGNQFTEKEVLLADSNFFNFFSFRLLAGDKETVLKEPKTLVLTETTVEKYFGNKSYDDIIGEVLILGNKKRSYKISGIAADPPQTSHLKFSMILSMNSWNYSKNTQWTSNNIFTYFKLKNASDIALMDDNLDGLVRKYVGPEIEQYIGLTLDEFRNEGGNYGFFNQHLHDIHFENYDGDLEIGGNKQNIWIFSIVALFVLVIAAVNFINLSTAKATDRSKEIGIRKTVGANKGQLISQFLFESVALVLVAAILALVGVIFSLNYFNELTSKQFDLSDVLNSGNLMIYAFSAVVIGIVSGFYPSLVLSTYRPVDTVKGRPINSSLKRFSARNVLVGFQFTLTAMAIILTIVVTKQLNHMRSYDLGFDKEQLLVINNAWSLDNHQSFKNELSQLTGIENVSVTQGYPPRITNGNVFRIEDTQEDHIMNTYYTDKDHLASMGMRLLQGRFFEDHQLDEKSVVLNERALKLTGWTDIEGKRILDFDDEEKLIPHNVIGVVEDFHFENFKNEIKPMIIFCSPKGGFVTMRIKGKNTLESVKMVENKWSEMTGGKPFDYTFVDQQFDNLFQTEKRLANLTIFFSILTIVVASLGLFGLAAFVARTRRKEFGIRKVLGAHEGTIWLLQFKYFVSIALIALVIAVPSAYYVTDWWLSDFVYHISNGAGIYGLAILAIFTLILLSVGYQSIKVSRTSPATVLKEE